RRRTRWTPLRRAVSPGGAARDRFSADQLRRLRRRSQGITRRSVSATVKPDLGSASTLHPPPPPSPGVEPPVPVAPEPPALAPALPEVVPPVPVALVPPAPAAAPVPPVVPLVPA